MYRSRNDDLRGRFFYCLLDAEENLLLKNVSVLCRIKINKIEICIL